MSLAIFGSRVCKSCKRNKNGDRVEATVSNIILIPVCLAGKHEEKRHKFRPKGISRTRELVPAAIFSLFSVTLRKPKFSYGAASMAGQPKHPSSLFLSF